MEFIPIKTKISSKSSTRINKYLDEMIDEEIEEMKRKKILLEQLYEMYYTNQSNLIKKAYETKQKEYVYRISSSNTVWRETDPIEIDEMLKLVFEDIRDELILKGYQAIFSPKYNYNPNTTDCRGCSDYNGYYLFHVIF